MRTTFFGRHTALYKRAFFTWLVFIPTAMVNGFIRQALVEKFTGELQAHQVSVLTGSAAFIVVGYYMLSKQVSQVRDSKLLMVGFAWMIMTIVFEFAMGRYISHLPWDKMLADYTVLQGRLWVLVLMTILLIPWLVKKLTVKIHLPQDGHK